jgi:putative ABC transport system permease protein
MTKTPAWRRYLTFWRADIADDVADELAFHTEMRIKEYMARGLSEEDARSAVTARLGDVDAARVECIELGHVRETHARQADVLDGLRADVRYALRSLGRSPGWTAVALLTIALGVGATTAVFSVADTLLLRPFPYRDASRVFMARREFYIDGNTVPVGVPFGMVLEWRKYAHTIEGAVLVSSGGLSRLGVGSDAVDVHVARVDTSFLAFAGARPVIGRNFNADEAAPTGPGAVMLTEQFWRRQFGGSHDVVGTVIQVDNTPRTIVGVVPASVSIPDFRAERADILFPVADDAKIGGPVLVRLEPGVSATTATAELASILKHANLPDLRPVPMEMPLRLTRPQDWLAIRQPIVMLAGAVALLLLVACTNVAHLLLARGAARQRELAVRHALGAGRSRLLRQLVTESIVLAAIGGALAVFVGWAGLHLLAAARPTHRDFVALTYVSANRGMVAIASSLAILCGLSIGLLAALRTAHRDLGLGLRLGAASVSHAGRRLRGSLVVGEVALSATLLVGALLLIHAVFDLQRTHLGFDARGLYAVSFSMSNETTLAERAGFGAILRERAAAVPGVKSATLADAVPGGRGFHMIALFETPGHEVSPTDASGAVAMYAVAPDYFSMMGMPLLAGRTFDAGSRERNEVIISATLAHQVWPDGIAIGRQLRNGVAKSRGADEAWQTVIGVVPDVVSSLVEGPASAGFYHPLVSSVGPGFMSGITLIVRMQDGDADAAARLKQFAAAVQPGKSPPTISNVREGIDDTMAEPRFIMRILVTFALLGVMLAAIGLFGVISYSVGQRTREIGVRMTLGATRPSIARLVVGDGIRLALVGIGVGLLGAVAATRLIQNLLYGVPRLDPFSFSLGAVLLLAVSIIACVVPMLRATGVDPAVAVRVD